MKPPQRSIIRKTRRVPNTAGRLVGKLDGTWFKLVPETHWLIYKAAIRAVRAQEIQFALGGAFALAGYTGRWRNTKDLDLYLQPKDREPAIQALHSAGFIICRSPAPLKVCEGRPSPNCANASSLSRNWAQNG